MKNSVFKVILSAGFMAALQSPCYATVYEALCGNEDCQIDISVRGIGGPSGFIPTDYISEWTQGKIQGFSSAKGIAGSFGGATAGLVGGAILLGPVGALGGLVAGAIEGRKAGKEFEGFFTVVGFDSKGERIAHSFYFVNKKTARRVRIELPILTGLAAGEKRSIEDIEAAFATKDARETVAKGKRLPAKLGLSTNTSLSKTGLTNNCWEDYLAKNPALSVWAASNIELAEKQRLRSAYVKCSKEIEASAD